MALRPPTPLLLLLAACLPEFPRVPAPVPSVPGLVRILPSQDRSDLWRGSGLLVRRADGHLVLVAGAPGLAHPGDAGSVAFVSALGTARPEHLLGPGAAFGRDLCRADLLGGGVEEVIVPAGRKRVGSAASELHVFDARRELVARVTSLDVGLPGFSHVAALVGGGDGRDALVVSTRSPAGETLALVFLAPTPASRVLTVLPSPPLVLDLGALGDVDGDGFPDLWIYLGLPGHTGRMQLLSGASGARLAHPELDGRRAVDLSDVDGDGRADFAVLGGSDPVTARGGAGAPVWSAKIPDVRAPELLQGASVATPDSPRLVVADEAWGWDAGGDCGRLLVLDARDGSTVGTFHPVPGSGGIGAFVDAVFDDESGVLLLLTGTMVSGVDPRSRGSATLYAHGRP